MEEIGEKIDSVFFEYQDEEKADFIWKEENKDELAVSIRLKEIKFDQKTS